MEKKSEFDNVTTITTSELPLPNRLQVETISDTALFSQKGNSTPQHFNPKRYFPKK